MIRRLLDEVPDDPTATEATAQAVQLARIEGYLSRDLVPTVHRTVTEAIDPLLERIEQLEEVIQRMTAQAEVLAEATAKSNAALAEIITVIHAEEEAGLGRGQDKSILRKLKKWVDEGER